MEYPNRDDEKNQSTYGARYGEPGSVGSNSEGNNERKEYVSDSGSHNSDEDAERLFKELWEWIKRENIPAHGWITALSSVALLVVTFGQLVIACNNYRESSPMIDYARKSADAADQIKGAAWDFKGSAQGIDGNFGNAVAQLQDQARKMDEARAASERQSAKSLQGTIDNFHEEQRPWIFAVSMAMPFEPEVGKDTPVQVSFSNLGRTPALGAYVISRVDIGPKEPPFPDFSAASGDHILGTIIPGINGYSYMTTDTAVGDTVKNPGLAAAYAAKISNIYVFGKFIYKDPFGFDHWTTFCMSHTSGMPLNQFGVCPRGNDVDKPKEK